MEKRLKILQLVPRFPFPMDDGGKIGIANIYKEFSAQGADVFLFSLSHIPIPDSAIMEAKKYGEELILEYPTKNTIPKIISSFFKKKSLYLSKHIDFNMLILVGALYERKKFDVIHADHSAMARLGLSLKSLYNIPLGLRLHNIEWMIWDRYANSLPKLSLKRFYIEQQRDLLKNAEKAYFEEADVCFAITDKDKERALDLSPKANVVVASAGVNLEEWLPDDSIKKNPFELIHATLYSWEHNINAIKWFIDNVLPKVRKEVPEAFLTLLGSNAPRWLHGYKQSGVNLIGYVDKVQPYLNKASIYIAPLFVGSGIRIKILEAMAMGLPVIASPVAAEGIKAGADDGLFIVDNEFDFAKKIIELINNPELIHALGKASRNCIQNNYSWKNNVGIMLDEYKKLLPH